MLPYNPLACVQKRSEHDKRRRRKVLSESEIGRLLEAGLTGPLRRTISRYQNRPRKDGPFKPANIPLHKQAELAELKAWRAHRTVTDSDVVVYIPDSMLENFNDDLQAAGIEKKDASGRTLDLHALRHTCATQLVSAGVDPETIRALMRHSSIMQTGMYLHADKKLMATAMATLPDIQPMKNTSPTESVSTIKTGTDVAECAKDCNEK